MSALHKVKKESIAVKSFEGPLLKRRKIGNIVSYWSHVNCVLDFSIKIFDYRIHDSERDFRSIDLQHHHEKNNDGAPVNPEEQVIEILDDRIVLWNVRDTTGHFKSAIHLKPLESSVDFDDWKEAFRKLVAVPELHEECTLNSLPFFESSAEEKNHLYDILTDVQGGPRQNSLDDVWGLIKMSKLQLSLDEFIETSCEKIHCTISFGSQATFCDHQHSNSWSLYKRFFISSQDSSEILICVLCRSSNVRCVVQLIGKLYLWDLVRELSSPSLSSVRTTRICLYSLGSNVIFGTAALSYAIEYIGSNVSNEAAAVTELDFTDVVPVSMPEFMNNETAAVACKDLNGPLMFERFVSADEIAALALTCRVVKFPLYNFSPPLDLDKQKELLSRAFFVDSSVVANIGQSDALSCLFPIVHKEALFAIKTCCFHPSYTLDAFGGSKSRLLAWQYQIYSQSWLANFSRMSQHGQSFCTTKMQAFEEDFDATFVSREADDRDLLQSRFRSKLIGADGKFEVSVLHDLASNPEWTLKVKGEKVKSAVLHRFEDNLFPISGLRGSLIFLVRDTQRPFKLRCWGSLQVDSLLDQKSVTQWVHLRKFEDSLAPSKKTSVFAEGFAVLITASLCFDREAIDLPTAALEPSAFISPPRAFSEWVSGHPQSHIIGSCEKSHYMHYMFQILCRRIVSSVAQLKIQSDSSISWSSIPWNQNPPFPSELRGILVCFAHTYGIAPIFFHLQFAQELSDVVVLSNYDNHNFVKQAVMCLADVLLLACGMSNSDFVWFKTLTITLFQSASRALYNTLCCGRSKHLDFIFILAEYVGTFSKLNAVKTGMNIVEHAMLKGIPADTTSIGASSQTGDFDKENLMTMVVQDFVSLGDSIFLQNFAESSNERALLPFPSVYIGKHFLDILATFNAFLRQWRDCLKERETSKLIACAVLAFYRRIICNAVDLCISSTLKGHDVLELWNCMQTIHSFLSSTHKSSLPHEFTADFSKLLAPVWLETLPETANALALAICMACKVDNLEVYDEKKFISSSVIDGLRSSGLIVHEMQFVSQKCLTTASDELRLRMMTGLVRIPVRAAQELLMWIHKTFLKILPEAYRESQLSYTSEDLKHTNQLCILCNNLSFLKDNVLNQADEWTRYYEDLVAGSNSSSTPGLEANFDKTGDKICFGPGTVQVIVTTGSALGSGTTSRVFITLHGKVDIAGESESSGKQQLKNENDDFNSGGANFSVSLEWGSSKGESESSGKQQLKSFDSGGVDTFSIVLETALMKISKIEAK